MKIENINKNGLDFLTCDNELYAVYSYNKHTLYYVAKAIENKNIYASFKSFKNKKLLKDEYFNDLFCNIL